MEKIRFTEYLDLSLEDESWYCHVCAHKIGPVAGNYKEGCLVYERKPQEIHDPIIPEARTILVPKKNGSLSLSFIALDVEHKLRRNIFRLDIRSPMT